MGKRENFTRRRGERGEREECRVGTLCLLAFLFLPAIACAGQPDAGQPGYFLRLATDARILGMGGAGVSFPDSGMFVNPAGIAVSGQKRLQVTAIALPFPDTSCNFLSYTPVVGRHWGIGLGVPVLKVTGAEKRTGEYESNGTFDDQQMAIGLGVARSFPHGFSVGLALKAMQQRFCEKTTTTNDMDMGMLYQYRTYAFSGRDSGSSPLNVGVCFQNILGSTVKQASGENKMPQTIKAGISFCPIDRVLIAMDMEKSSGQASKGHLGVEYSPINPLNLCAGYDDQGYLTAGVGIKVKNFTLDYGLQNHSYKLSHRVSVGMRFGADVRDAASF
ncbi:MAG: PorV/PorQ family protein [bacterium]